MALVRFSPGNQVVEVEAGTTILEAARLVGVLIESPCNSNATCGKCKVRLDAESMQNVIQHGEHHLTEKEANQGFVLSCQTKILGDIKVEVVDKQQNKTLKVLSFGKSFDVQLDGFIKKRFFPERNKTQVLGGDKLLGEEEGNTVSENYGVVVDIGTTTMVTALMDINTGKEIDSIPALNPQSIYAQDVLSRIKFASEEKGLQTLYSEFIQEVNGMIDEIAERSGVNHGNIYEVIFSGNTCMLHLATNVNPTSLGKYPYISKITGGNHIAAAEHRLHVAEFGVVYLPPVISAYVGADITSGILASNLSELKGITLFVDIGTNGEMVIGFDGNLSATSTAAGPAFEGMNITFGMRAGKGAIELFEIEPDGSVTIKTIGDQEATGICGSGLLDIVGELVAHGVINKNGRFVKPDTPGISQQLQARLVNYDGKLAFKVAEDVYLTQKDVRQVQLAKGAVRAGIEFLLRNKKIEASDLDRVFIAGSFGYHLRAKSLINIGLLPQEFTGKIDFLGNTSNSGGQAFLLNNSYRHLMSNVVKEVESLDLASYTDFDKVFVSCLNF
jgi:uncharacterized 2Fe-2S/4Fe-4S cluster protein (DUF4445 family)